MGDKIDILKIVLDFLKGNKVFLLIVTSLIGGGAAGHYLPKIVNAKPVEITVTAPKQTLIRKDCRKCESEIARLQAIIKKTKVELEKLKRWHK